MKITDLSSLSLQKSEIIPELEDLSQQQARKVVGGGIVSFIEDIDIPVVEDRNTSSPSCPGVAEDKGA